MILVYIIAVLISIYLIISAYIKINMKFWHSQPVFHIYNLKYWLKPPGFINRTAPVGNKFVNLINNSLLIFNDETKNTLQIKKIGQFIKAYYIIHPKATYTPSESDILDYLQSTNHPAYFNIYTEPRMLFSPTDTVVDDELIGVTSARVLNITIKGSIKFPAYYVDHLCVKPGYRKKNIAPQMIQTFYYNVARNNPKVNAYMFKREGQLNAIVPLICYDTHHFDISIFSADSLLTANLSVIHITAQSLNVFTNFIKEHMDKFDCMVLPDVSNLLHLIKSDKLWLYAVLKENGEIIAAYVFRPLELYYEGQKTIECIAIISNCKKDILLAGFNMALIESQNKSMKISQRLNGVLLIEETAHSKSVIQGLLNNFTSLRKYMSPTAFFLYNYACYSFIKDRTLLIY